MVFELVLCVQAIVYSFRMWKLKLQEGFFNRRLLNHQYSLVRLELLLPYLESKHHKQQEKQLWKKLPWSVTISASMCLLWSVFQTYIKLVIFSLFRLYVLFAPSQYRANSSWLIKQFTGLDEHNRDLLADVCLSNFLKEIFFCRIFKKCFLPPKLAFHMFLMCTWYVKMLFCVCNKLMGNVQIRGDHCFLSTFMVFKCIKF